MTPLSSMRSRGWRTDTGMNARIATLNIRQGGTKSAEALTNRLLGYDADLLVVTEFRANDAGLRLIAHLAAAGYTPAHPSTGRSQNTVLVASRRGITQQWPFPQEGLDPRHLWCVGVNETLVCGVYMPQGAAKLPYWEALISRARPSKIDLIIGDFNTGNNDLDKDPQGGKFVGPEMPGRLIASGYSDVWRSLHPGERQYSWFSRPAGNGFRLDYIFATPEWAQRVSTCEFDQGPREAGETDHSGLVASLEWP